jgi:hypothetical protein
MVYPATVVPTATDTRDALQCDTEASRFLLSQLASLPDQRADLVRAHLEDLLGRARHKLRHYGQLV